jgi:hypothetical protein
LGEETCAEEDRAVMVATVGDFFVERLDQSGARRI